MRIELNGNDVKRRAKDRETNTVQAAVIGNTDRPTLSGFVVTHAAPGAKVYIDEHSGYDWVENREMVRHSVKEYVRDQAHTNGIESFWALLKRGYVGTVPQDEQEALGPVCQRVFRAVQSAPA